jgi:phosphoglycerate dehydrogenase-like enzyme
VIRILKVNTYAPDTSLYQAFGPDVVFDIHRAGPDGAEPPSLDRCRAADAVINCAAGLTIGVDPKYFDRCRIVVREGVGYDTLDLAGWGARGIPACNVPDYGTTEVADHALGLLLALARGTTTYQEAIRDKTDGWNFGAAPMVRRLRGQTFAILGLGRIGLATARRASAFDMKVVFYDPYLPNGAELAAGYERVRSLDELMARADILSVHTPLNDETRNLIGSGLLAKAKPNLIVINTARGPIVDQAALIDALRRGEIAGAALDVTDPEPPPADDPLLGVPNLIVAPHIGSATHTAREAMATRAVDNLLAALDGEPMPHPVHTG